MFLRSFVLLVVLCLSACFGSSKPTRYYLLSGNEGGGAPVDQRNSLRVILVGPVELAKYLDRSNMVSRVGSNELLVSDFDSWGEELDRGVASTIAANLSRNESLSAYMFISRPNLLPLDIEMPLLIEQFDCDDRGTCRATVFSSLKYADGEPILPIARHQFSRAIESSSANEQAKVLSQLVADVSQAISARIVTAGAQKLMQSR